MKKKLVIFVILAVLASTGIFFTNMVQLDSQAEKKYEFSEALKLGVVDFAPNPWGAVGYQRMIDNIHLLGPGVINEFGFMYGGVNQQYLNMIKNYAAQLTKKLPKTLLGGRFQEHLDVVNYPVRKFTCGGDMGTMEFDHRLMVGRKAIGNYSWIDLTNPISQEYFICQGTFYIDQGLRMLAFTFPKGILEQSSNKDLTLQAFADIQEKLNEYAENKGIKIYWGGDGYLSKILNLDYTFQPIRVYTNHSWSNPLWKNKIIRNGVGVGFSYVLSKAMIDSMKAETNPKTRIIFYVDNYDGVEDDLRRFMELDPQNRRYMMQESVRVAKLNGVTMSLPLNQCEGCISKDKIVDPCHVLPAPKSHLTGYDAFACGDFPSISDALKSAPVNEVVLQANYVSSSGVCGKSLKDKGDCNIGCLFRSRYVPLPSILRDAHYKFSYSLGLSGYCNILSMKRLNSIEFEIKHVNEWALCAPEVAKVCNSNCIWHKGTNLEYRHSGNLGKKVKVIYSKDSSGKCTAEDEILL